MNSLLADFTLIGLGGIAGTVGAVITGGALGPSLFTGALTQLINNCAEKVFERNDINPTTRQSFGVRVISLIVSSCYTAYMCGTYASLIALAYAASVLALAYIVGQAIVKGSAIQALCLRNNETIKNPIERRGFSLLHGFLV